MTHKWLNLKEITDSCKAYEDLFRLLVLLMPIEILRNPFDIEDGITLVGEDIAVKGAYELITNTVNTVETAVRFKNLKNRSLHLSEVKANYRHELISKHNITLYSKLHQPREGLELFEYTNKPLRLQYIKDCSLKTLKPYRGRK